MTDIVMRLKEAVCLPDTGCVSLRMCVCDVMEDAADEIQRLTACLKWEQNWLERVGTHAPGCWQWGPGHYLCAVRHIEGLEHVATEPADTADHAQG